jgi:hypothetical protein
MRHVRWVVPLVALALVPASCADDADSGTTPVLAAELDADGVSLLLQLASCKTTEQTAEVTETETEVRVTVTTEGGASLDCADGVEVELTEPLGDRPLIDVPTDTEIVVDGRARAAD